ncbi:MAG: ABC transporter permease [Trueperaceae bacterium]|nr:ABC transporter permease [Trueperaceae bacterium]
MSDSAVRDGAGAATAQAARDDRLERRPRRRKIPWVIWISIGLLAVAVLVALLAPLLEPYRPTAQSLRARLAPPAGFGGSVTHVLGTDHLGRDILSRLIESLRMTLFIAAMGTLIGAVVGVGLGLLAGTAGGFLDSLIMFLVDIQLAVPFTLAALTVIGIFGTSIAILIPVIGLAGWSQYARLTRSQVLSVRQTLYVEAVQALGGSQPRVALRHVLPNVTSPIIVLVTYTFSQIMLLESSLSFLGLGVQPPQMSLGMMVGDGRNYLIGSWWIAIAPAVVLVAITVALALFGDWLRDRLDPRLER